MNIVLRLHASEVDLDGLVGTLRQRIAEGEKLPAERTLGEQLNVNRHTLRKALIQLRASGELASRAPRQHAALARGGAALARDTNPLEVIELRLALEPIFARLAAIRATPLEIVKIEKAATTLAETESSSADLTFHRLIAAATPNTLAADVYSLLRQIGADSRIYVRSITGCPTAPAGFRTLSDCCCDCCARPRRRRKGHACPPAHGAAANP